MIVLTDEATQFYQLIPLYWKSDATYELRRWIKSVRSHPAFVGLDYQMIGKIITDNESVWKEDCREFQSMVEKVGGLEIEYCDPADHARDNARAEGANKIIEAGIQSLLYEKNLPPSWWQRAANDVMFLANRFPPYNLDAATPSDGDQPSPLERLFHGYYSRHRIYRELDSYVAVGTPALCHLPKVKGSDLEPKVRWGIAIGHRDKVTRWMCPFTRSQFKNRSFTALTLKTGLNWSQFLGLGDIAPSAQSRMLPHDEHERWTIELPAVRPNAVKSPPPVRELIQRISAGETDEIIRAEVTSNDKDLCEFFPRIKKRGITPNTHEGDMSSDNDAEKGVIVTTNSGNPLTIPPTHDDGEMDVESDDDENLHVEGSHEPRVTTHEAHECLSPTDSPSDPLSITHTARDGVGPPSPTHDDGERVTRRKRPRKRRTRKRRPSNDPPMQELTIPAYGLDPEAEQQLEELESELMHSYAVDTDGETSWSRVCKRMNQHFKGLPFEQHHIYRLWLLTKPVRDSEPQLFVEDLPKSLCEGRGFLKEGLHLPYPSGPHWMRLIGNAEYRKTHGDRIEGDDLEEEQTYLAMSTYRRYVDGNAPALALLCSAMVGEQATLREVDSFLNSIISDEVKEFGVALSARRIKQRKSSIKDAADPAPKTIIDALMGDRAEEWVESIYKEYNGLVDQGVFSHNWTQEDLRKQGITSKPVPCSTALTHKYKDGKLDRLKTRICIAGHKGNVTKGVHYQDVFSPSPVQHTERLLQAMMVNLHLENLTWDIKQAYTWAPLPPGERIAVIYPDGFKRTDDHGNELFMILERNLYGMPSAARGWGKHRDQTILTRFNSDGWECTQSIHDPCLFVIDRLPDRGAEGQHTLRRESPKAGQQRPASERPEGQDLSESDDYLPDGVERSWVLIHTDDCDAYGTSKEVLHEINAIMNDEWQTEIVDSSFVLGVKRTLVRDPEGWHVTLTMTSFIDDLVKVFQDDLNDEFGRRIVKTPFPEHIILTKADTPEEGEVARNIKRGYQRLVGSLLWCVRHVFPICAYGCSQLCKLMATPTDHAWKCALHMLKYIDQHKERGIKFSETDDEPCAFVDASNRDDPQDGRTQYGYIIHWGGPLVVKSGKLNHVGINSTYNEYMALHHCIKQIVWMRQLLDEVGLYEYISMPTTVYADNKQANNLCAEDLVTAGNMYFRTGYHYNKEAVRDGYIAPPKYIASALNCSDACTKGLGANKIREFEPILHGHQPLTHIMA